METFEQWLRAVSASAGMLALVYILWQGVWRGARRPVGRSTGYAAQILRMPIFFVMGAAWIGLCVVLWRPLPFHSVMAIRSLLDIFGASLYFSGLGLYMWGARSLGEMYRPASGAGVQLTAHPRLVTDGPYAWLRHPLYAGLQVSTLGGLLLFRNWTFVFVFVNFLFLFVRARREEAALAAEFGAAWEAYTRQVPFWGVRLK